ncbi:hypothetical protein SBDP1_100082 [Syntrophobacter sp. SbD1]|nr:hypothetical protein SBDP1_100082 [Syntrophobacter sp. SbD1]
MSEALTGNLPGTPEWLGNERAQMIIAVLIWLVPMIVISVMVAYSPLHRTVTPVYRQACADWWAGRGLYTGTGGLHYLPQFVLMFSPF